MVVMIKCLSMRNLLHSLPAFVFFALAKGTGLAIVQRNSAYLTNVVLSLRDIWRATGTLRAKRRETQLLRVVPDSRLLRSEGFGLFDAPWVLVRVLRQGQELNERRLKLVSEARSKSSVP